MAIYVPENVKQSRRRGHSCSPLPFCVVCNAGDCQRSVGCSGSEGCGKLVSRSSSGGSSPSPPLPGAHPAPKMLPSRCLPEDRLSPISTGQRLQPVPASLWPCTAAGDRHRATAQAAAPPAHAAWPPLPSGNSLFAPQTVSLGPAWFPINFYRKYKMTSGSLWQIGFHSSYKQGRALLSLNFSQMSLSSSTKRKN